MSDFTQVFRDDFGGSSLDYSIWKAQYAGNYGNGMFRWDPSQLEVGDGKLTIATEREGGSWVSGGLSTIPDGQTYGSYEFRARIDPGQGTAGAILLWPSNNQWTDEVDIIETNKPGREQFAFTNHGTPNVSDYIDVNVADWHTYRMDWTPGSLKLFVDGEQKSELTTDVPSQPMSFGAQGMVLGAWETWFGGAPDGSTPDRVEIELDWVRVSAYTPSAGSDPEPQAALAAPSGTASGIDWLAAAQTYIENDGSWEGSWRNQVAAGQISLDDVASRLQAGLGNSDFWQ